MLECAAAFIVKENKVLLGKRSAMRKFYPNIWDVFGGHQKPNETIEDTLKRELGEELGIIPLRWKFLITVSEPNSDKYGQIQYHFYLVTDYDGEPENLQPEEHSLIKWFEFDKAVKLSFPHPLYIEWINQILKEL